MSGRVSAHELVVPHSCLREGLLGHLVVHPSLSLECLDLPATVVEDRTIVPTSFLPFALDPPQRLDIHLDGVVVVSLGGIESECSFYGVRGSFWTVASRGRYAAMYRDELLRRKRAAVIPEL